MCRGSLYRRSTVPTMCLIKKKKLYSKLNGILHKASHCFTRYLIKEQSIFSLQEKQKIKTTKVLHTVSSPWPLQLFPVSPSHEEPRLAWVSTRSSQSIKIGKSDLIDIDCIDQSVEIDDTLVSFIA